MATFAWFPHPPGIFFLSFVAYNAGTATEITHAFRRVPVLKSRDSALTQTASAEKQQHAVRSDEL